MTSSPGERSAFILLLGLLVPVVGGKWGSYIGLPGSGIFLSDVLLGIGTIGLLLRSKRLRARRAGLRLTPLVVAAALVFVSLEILRGSGAPAVRLRDSAPYLYLCLFPVVAVGFGIIGQSTVLRAVDRALAIHAAWSVPALLGVLPSIALPTAVFGFPVFETRPDIDVLLLGVFLASTLRRDRHLSPSLKFLVGASVLASMVTQSSRAALAGGLVAAGVIYFLTRPPRLKPASVILVCGAVAAACLTVVLSSNLPTSPLLQSGAIARAGLVPTAAYAAEGGRGTAQGRSEAWQLMFQYYGAAGTPLLGIGPGAEIVRDSGAVAFLSGDLSVRAPHSWWVNLWVRYGPVGALVWLLVLVNLFRRQNRVSETGMAGAGEENQRAGAVGSGLGLAVLVAGSLGVVIESPFGAQVLLLAGVLRSCSVRPASRHGVQATTDVRQSELSHEVVTAGHRKQLEMSGRVLGPRLAVSVDVSESEGRICSRSQQPAEEGPTKECPGADGGPAKPPS